MKLHPRKKAARFHLLGNVAEGNHWAEKAARRGKRIRPKKKAKP